VRSSLSFIRRFVPPALLMIAFVGPVSTAAWQDAYTALRTFHTRVREYAELHRCLESTTVPPFVITSKPYLLFASRAALATAIRSARADARQGDIFSPPVAAMVRSTIDQTLREHGIDMLGILAEEETLGRPFEVRVNAEYPLDRPLSFMPPTLLEALPALPPELQYRFVGLDLILLDVDARLIVDFVPDALRITTSTD
jgi:hypothetical protein